MLHKALDKVLNEEQVAAVDKYIDALYEAQDLLAKNSFLVGCKFTAAFLLEALALEKGR